MGIGHACSMDRFDSLRQGPAEPQLPSRPINWLSLHAGSCSCGGALPAAPRWPISVEAGGGDAGKYAIIMLTRGIPTSVADGSWVGGGPSSLVIGPPLGLPRPCLLTAPEPCQAGPTCQPEMAGSPVCMKFVHASLRGLRVWVGTSINGHTKCCPKATTLCFPIVLSKF